MTICIMRLRTSGDVPVDDILSLSFCLLTNPNHTMTINCNTVQIAQSTNARSATHFNNSSTNSTSLPMTNANDTIQIAASTRAPVGTRSSRHLLQRAQTDPPARCWFSVTAEPTATLSTRSPSHTVAVHGIDDARFSTGITPSLTRSISDSIVARPLLLSFASSVSIAHNSDSVSLNCPTLSSSVESLPGRHYQTSKRCYKHLSSLVSNSTIPSIPEQTVSAIVDSDRSMKSSEEALSPEIIRSDPESLPYRSMPFLVRDVESPLGGVPARRFHSFVSGGGDSQTWSTPPSTSHYVLAARFVALQEQRSSSTSARRTCCDETTAKLPRRAVPLLAASGGLHYRVLEYLHCGLTEVALDGEQLCANRIVYLVNLTGFHLPKRRRHVCKCEQSRLHKLEELSGVKLSKALPLATIFQRFERVNAFIATARSKGYQILLFDNDNEGSHMMALQYIMHYHRTSFVYACTHLERHYGGRLRLSSFVFQVLEAWEERCNGTSVAADIKSA